MTDDVSRLTDPGLRMEVEGDDVDMCRRCWAIFGIEEVVMVDLVVGGAAGFCCRLVALIGS